MSAVRVGQGEHIADQPLHAMSLLLDIGGKLLLFLDGCILHGGEAG